MTKANYNPPKLDEDDLLPEYDFSGGVSGKHRQAYKQGHSVTIYHADDTVTQKYFPPVKPEDKQLNQSSE
jgi:hypothetical protein